MSWWARLAGETWAFSCAVLTSVWASALCFFVTQINAYRHSSAEWDAFLEVFLSSTIVYWDVKSWQEGMDPREILPFCWLLDHRHSGLQRSESCPGISCWGPGVSQRASGLPGTDFTQCRRLALLEPGTSEMGQLWSGLLSYTCCLHLNFKPKFHVMTPKINVGVTGPL